MRFIKVRRARATYWCALDFAHDRTIKRGDYYAQVDTSPDDIRNSSDKWSYQKVCNPCYAAGKHAEGN